MTPRALHHVIGRIWTAPDIDALTYRWRHEFSDQTKADADVIRHAKECGALLRKLPAAPSSEPPVEVDQYTLPDGPTPTEPN
jgi:hypothetical protein